MTHLLDVMSLDREVFKAAVQVVHCLQALTDPEGSLSAAGVNDGPEKNEAEQSLRDYDTALQAALIAENEALKKEDLKLEKDGCCCDAGGHVCAQAEKLEKVRKRMGEAEKIVECVRREAQFGVGGGRCWLALIDTLTDYDRSLASPPSPAPVESKPKPGENK